MSQSVEELKAKGNECLKEQNFQEAVDYYTKAIHIDDKNHVLYSNRSAAHASRGDYESALYDAENAIKMSPEWFKGYSRKATALSYLGRHSEALTALDAGLEKNPGNQALLDMRTEIQGLMTANQQQPAGEIPGLDFGNLFNEETMWSKLGSHPKTSMLLADPDFCTKMKTIQANPNNMQEFANDHRIMLALSVLLGVADMTEDMEKQEELQRDRKREEELKAKKAEEEAILNSMSKNKRTALDEKEAGNAAYKARKFAEAIAHYDRAIELDPTNFDFPLNKAAALLESGEYDSCISIAEDVIQKLKGQDQGYIVSKAYGRIASAYKYQKKWSEALEACNKSLIEKRLPIVVRMEKDLKRIIKEEEENSYINEDLSLQKKEEGNEMFRTGHFPEAIKLYEEAIRRNPKDHVLYSNRAACYMKLREWESAISDCKKCLELNPTFLKGYTRKATIHFYKKEYTMALEAYDEALKLDPNNQEVIEGINRTLQASSSERSQQQSSDESPEEVIRRAERDPEVREILQDPVMQTILKDMQSDPGAAAEHLKNPMIQKKIEKLIQAGIIKIGR